MLQTFSIISDELSEVRTMIERELSDCSRQVRELAVHIRAGRGKMLRPGVLLLSGLACGGVTERHIHTAAIIEMIHSATLLHDDVVDEGDMRRGVATLNSIRGNESAVLLGDFLLSRVFRLCAALESPAARTIASAAVQTCEGELRQIAQRSNFRLSEREYIEIIAEKTAALFSGACSLGAMLAGAGARQIKMLADYGSRMGIAFQITDDLLDLTGDGNRTGKPTGNDLECGKLTLPVIYFLKSAGRKEKAAAIRLLRDRQPSAKRKTAALSKMLNEQGSIDYTRRRAAGFVKDAIGSLAGLKKSAGKEALVETARFIAERTA